MFAHAEIATQPAFYLLIAGTVLLSLGFVRGRRRNRRILRGSFDALSETLKPRDQQFTNIGGQTGYHANFIPGACRSVRRVDATLTLLPRQSWLYMPFSYLIQHFDRLFLTFFVNKRGRKVLKEGHLIETRFEKMRGNRIDNIDQLQKENLEWEGMNFHLYYMDQAMRDHLLKLKDRLGQPGNFRHAAIVPCEEAAYLFQIPRPQTVGPIVSAFRDWFDEYVEAARDVSEKA